MKKISYIFEFYAIISGFMTMQERFDIELDPYALAKQGRSVSGRLVAKSLSRVVDLVGSEAEFEAQLDFGIDPNGLRIVSGAVQGKVTLQCQRCLEKFEGLLDIKFSLALVRSEQQIASLPEEYEPLLIEHELILLKDIVEDEIILALPTAPVHKLEECPAATAQIETCAREVDEEDEQVTQRPFANLAELMKQKK